MQDVFRKEYKAISEKQALWMGAIKEKAQELWDMIDESGDPSNGRMIAVAKTKLETSIMWAIKAIT